MKRALFSLWEQAPLPLRVRKFLVWLVTQKFLVGVVGVVLNEAGEVLLFRHTYRGKYPWGLPSGWLKAGEPVEQALAREIHEESGFHVRVLEPLVVDNAVDPPRLDLVYLCQYERGAFSPSAEVDQARFFRPHALPSLLDEQIEIIKKAIHEQSD